MIDVVTAVVMRKGKILILRRGEEVSTYKGKWACISGYLEENERPLERAYKEMEEEAGLKKDDVKLIKEAKVMEFYDEEERKEWRVHPFLFETEKEEISIDWEHTEYRWIEPKKIKEYDTVPKLKEVITMLF